MFEVINVKAISRKGTGIQTESRLEVARGWGQGSGGRTRMGGDPLLVWNFLLR